MRQTNRSVAATIPALCAGMLLGCAGSAPPRPTSELERALRNAGAGRILATTAGDLDRDTIPEIVVITRSDKPGQSPRGGEVLVLQRRGGWLQVVWRQPGQNPWTVQLGDVDGNGRLEVLVGVFKPSRRDPIQANRSHFYTWNGKRLIPRWLGSRLSRRYVDLALGDVDSDGRHELISLEKMPAGRHRVAVYRWFSFGFHWVGSTAALPGLRALHRLDGHVLVQGQTRRCVRVIKDKVRLLGGKECFHAKSENKAARGRPGAERARAAGL